MGRAGLDATLHGCDLSPRAVAFARDRAAAAGAPVEFFECDVLGEDFPDGYDLYTCALFLHHLEEGDVVALLRKMSRGKALLVSDLVRSHSGYYAACLGSRLLSRSDVVRFDAPQSVRNAFTRDEMADLARRAGLTGTTVRGGWPFRMLVSWRRE